MTRAEAEQALTEAVQRRKEIRATIADARTAAERDSRVAAAQVLTKQIQQLQRFIGHTV